MAETTYNYSIATDVPAGKVNGKRLMAEVQANATITIAIKSIDVSGDAVDITFKDALAAGEQTELKDVVLANHSGTPLAARPEASDGTPIYTLEPRKDVDAPNIISPNWCDKTTWWEKSTAVVGETLTDSGDLTTYNSANDHWICLHHGKVTQEHNINSNYQVKVYVDAVEKTENSQGTTDGDYSVNYDTGDVTFNSAQAGGAVITADYSYSPDTAGNSCWTVAPDSGKKLSLRAVEVQFSVDIDLTDTAIFEIYGFVEVFAPHLWDGYDPPGPYPAGTKIPLQANKYPRMHNYIDESQQAYPNVPALGGNSWRGMQQQMQIFRWPYTHDFGQYVELASSKGMELRIFLEADTPFGGERAVATLYARSEDE